MFTSIQLDYLRLIAKMIIADLDNVDSVILRDCRDEAWRAMTQEQKAEVNEAAMVIFGEWM